MSRRVKAERAAEQLIEKVQTNDLNLIANYLKIQIKYEKFPSSLSGAYFKEGENLYIAVNDGHNEHRQRFSIAHEIGHHIMHESAIFHYDKLIYDKSSKQERQIFYRAEDIISLDEVEANHFAAALLMPRKSVEEDFLKMPSVCQLSEKYNVSEEAMQYRLINIGLM